jgi:hypothetical protein
VHAALNGLANAPAATSADAAAAFYGLAGGAFAGAVGGNSGGKRPRRSASASGPVAALDPALTAHHRLDFIERRVLPAQIGPGGSSSSGPRYSYKQRTCVVCKSPNAAHYCTACGPQVVLCGNSAKVYCGNPLALALFVWFLVQTTRGIPTASAPVHSIPLPPLTAAHRAPCVWVAELGLLRHACALDRQEARGV